MLLGLDGREARALARRLHRDVDDRVGEEQHLDVVRVAAEIDGLAAHRLAVGLHRGDAAAALGDDRVGPARGEQLAARRAAGLADRHAALRRARRVERPAALEVLALVMDRVDLRTVGEHRLVAVEHHGVGLPRLPQLRDHLGELVGDVVALVVRPVLLVAVVLGRTVVAAGHAVPADPALGDVVERVDQAGQQVGRVLRHRQRRHEADRPGRHREVRHQHGRVELGRARGVAQVGVVRALVGVGNVRGVLDDHVVEAGTVEAAGKVDEDVRHHPAMDVGSGEVAAPALGAVALGQEPRQVERLLHDWNLARRRG